MEDHRTLLAEGRMEGSHTWLAADLVEALRRPVMVDLVVDLVVDLQMLLVAGLKSSKPVGQQQSYRVEQRLQEPRLSLE